MLFRDNLFYIYVYTVLQSVCLSLCMSIFLSVCVHLCVQWNGSVYILTKPNCHLKVIAFTMHELHWAASAMFPWGSLIHSIGVCLVKSVAVHWTCLLCQKRQDMTSADPHQWPPIYVWSTSSAGQLYCDVVSDAFTPLSVSLSACLSDSLSASVCVCLSHR